MENMADFNIKNRGKTAAMGYAEADITPQKPVELVGFFRPDNRSRGILHPLKLQTMVWKKGDRISCLITLDSLGFTTELSDCLRDQAAGCLNVTREHVMLCFSHTHSAPNAALEPEYFAYVCEQAVQTVRAAGSDLSPVSAAWGIGENLVGLNRRDELDNLDPRLGILKITDADSGRLRMLLLRVTAHANILSSDNYLISADYFGVARERLERELCCPVMMVQGAAGDVRPRFHQDNTEYLEIHSYEAAEQGFTEEYRKRYTGQSEGALAQTAEMLCAEVTRIIGELKAEPVVQIETASTFCRFTADVPFLEKARDIAEEAKREAGLDGTDWLREVERLHREGVREQSSDVEIQYFRLNEGCLCGIANEAMSRISLDVWRESGTPYLFFNGYTNGCNSYLPTAEEYDKGGYEVLWSNLVYFPYHGRVMPFNRDTAKQLIGKIVEDWKHRDTFLSL